jgi:calcineurin-like phosphoesterase family protein
MKPVKETLYSAVSENNIAKGDIKINDLVYITNKLSLLKKEGYFFTEEQLNQMISDIIKDSLNTATGNEDINKESIKEAFQETFNKFKV